MSVAAPQKPVPPLARPVSALFGVGPERASQLARVEIHTVEDLLLYRPRRYEDRTQFRPITELQAGESAITHGTVLAQGVKWFHKHTKSIFELILSDGTARLHCRWWNLPYMEKYFAVGNEVVVYGKLVSAKPRTIDHPETEIIETGEEKFIHLNRITPIYPLTEGLPQRWLRGLLWRTLAAYESQITEPWPELTRRAQASENGARSTAALSLSRSQAIRQLHFPETLEQPEAARRRLALDEFVELQLSMQRRRRNLQTKARALPCAGDNRLIKPFLAQLGFKLTDSQTNVLREMRRDLGGIQPMRRLLQGDVGSGKTVVAACSALMALESGYDVALMAPTEILADQHFLNFSKWFAPLGVPVAIQTSSRKVRSAGVSPAGSGGGSPTGPPRTPGEDARLIPKRETRGSAVRCALTIGTHALLEESFAPGRLGLVIIDEQHKFGVSQREELVRKGNYPHLLVMTATPIPRTLGLTLYGDLDVSVIEKPPPGRGKVMTFVRTAQSLPKVWEFIRSRLSEGRQAYVVYPRVEESGDNDVKAVTKEFENVSRALAPNGVGLLHGRLKSREKDEVMAAFRNGKLKVLLATSLVEVGVDIPNATVMLIENAEQFGLAQLHQLRGRIGRGGRESYCILVAAARSAESRERLRVLEQTNGGFEIAEADLKLRGPGELLGQQQSGLPRFRFGNLATDLELIRQAKALVEKG